MKILFCGLLLKSSCLEHLWAISSPLLVYREIIEESVCSLALHSSIVIRSVFHRAIFCQPFLPQKLKVFKKKLALILNILSKILISKLPLAFRDMNGKGGENVSLESFPQSFSFVNSNYLFCSIFCSIFYFIVFLHFKKILFFRSMSILLNKIIFP